LEEADLEILNDEIAQFRVVLFLKIQLFIKQILSQMQMEKQQLSLNFQTISQISE
jgi:hypothetical protein